MTRRRNYTLCASAFIDFACGVGRYVAYSQTAGHFRSAAMAYDIDILIGGIAKCRIFRRRRAAGAIRHAD